VSAPVDASSVTAHVTTASTVEGTPAARQGREARSPDRPRPAASVRATCVAAVRYGSFRPARSSAHVRRERGPGLHPDRTPRRHHHHHRHRPDRRRVHVQRRGQLRHDHGSRSPCRGPHERRRCVRHRHRLGLRPVGQAAWGTAFTCAIIAGGFVTGCP